MVTHAPSQLPEEYHHEHITLDVGIDAPALEIAGVLEPEPDDEPPAGDPPPVRESSSARFARALDSFVPEVDPTTLPDIEACIRVGNELLDTGKSLSAREVFKHALVLAPKDYRVNIGLGRSYYNYGELLLAKMFFKKAILLNPTHAMAHFHLGTLLQAQGRPDEAMKEYKIAIDYNPQLARLNGRPI